MVILTGVNVGGVNAAGPLYGFTILFHDKLAIWAFRDYKRVTSVVVEVTELHFEVRSNLQGRLEDNMASEATKKADEILPPMRVWLLQ